MASNGPNPRKKIHPILKVTSECKVRGNGLLITLPALRPRQFETGQGVGRAK